jgi:hypothetical protein
MDRADAAWRAELARTTIAELAAGVLGDASPRARAKGAAGAAAVTGGAKPVANKS